MSELNNVMQLQVLHFLIQKVRICVDLKYLNKVLLLPALEPVPNSPAYVAGILNFAGRSIPIIDLALRLNLKRNQPYSINTSIILCSDGSHEMGMIVDEILGLAVVAENSLQMRSEFSDPNSPFLATVTLGNELSLLINVNQILTTSGMNTEKAWNQVNESLMNMAKNL